KDLRFPKDTEFLPDIDIGSYLATYWVQKGVDQDAIAWGSTQVKWLHENDRMFEGRDHIHTLMYVVRWSLNRDEDGVPPALALDPVAEVNTLMGELGETAARRQAAEDSLRDSERQLRVVTDSAQVAIARLDTEARYQFVNKHYADRLGLTPEQVIGKRIPEV